MPCAWGQLCSGNMNGSKGVMEKQRERIKGGLSGLLQASGKEKNVENWSLLYSSSQYSPPERLRLMSQLPREVCIPGTSTMHPFLLRLVQAAIAWIKIQKFGVQVLSINLPLPGYSAFPSKLGKHAGINSWQIIQQNSSIKYS